MPTARKLVRDWARRHRLELMINWKNVEKGRPLNRIGRWSNFMSYLPQVVETRHIGGFVASSRFDDGTEKYMDVCQWFKGPVFEPLNAARESTKKRHNKRMARTRKIRRSP